MKLLNKKNLLLLTLFISFHSIASNHDPFEDFNRTIWAFNEFLDDNIAKPTAEIYTSITPQFIEHGVTNFFRNLNELDNTANQLLQGKPMLALNDFSRFIVNSTIGIAGFIDVGSNIGLGSFEASSVSVSSVAVTMNVAEVASACNVTVPEAESKSEDPLATAHERFVSIFPAVPAVKAVKAVAVIPAVAAV